MDEGLYKLFATLINLRNPTLIKKQRGKFIMKSSLLRNIGRNLSKETFGTNVSFHIFMSIWFIAIWTSNFLLCTCFIVDLDFGISTFLTKDKH